MRDFLALECAAGQNEGLQENEQNFRHIMALSSYFLFPSRPAEMEGAGTIFDDEPVAGAKQQNRGNGGAARTPPSRREELSDAHARYRGREVAGRCHNCSELS
jgi:hypothetical protein